MPRSTQKNPRKLRRKTSKALKPLSVNDGSNVIGYCVKCREKRNMVSPKKVKTKNGRFMMKGTCPECGTKMNKFI